MQLKTIEWEYQKMIELKDANIFQGENEILNGVNMEVRTGEFCYIFGKSGSGKSSLLKTLYGDLPLKQGSGTVSNFDLKGLDYTNKYLFRRTLGVVFQDYFLFESWDVFHNLDYILRALGWPDKTVREQRIKEALLEVGLLKKIWQKVYTLSGGEQQLLTIARAIINNPLVLIADEPTNSLDHETADDFMQLIRKINQKYHTAVVFATHDQRVIQRFPARAYRCEGGKLIEVD